jgi:hypothetical protein
MRRIALLLAVLMVGCSQTRTVTVPAGESTINARVPDTAQATTLPEVPPAPITRPENVVIYRDTPDFTVDLSLLSVDRTDPDDQKVVVQVQAAGRTLKKRLPFPVSGEELRGVADSAGIEFSVAGSPTEWTVEGYVRDEPPWYRRIWMQVRLFMAFFGGLFFGYAITKLVPGL